MQYCFRESYVLCDWDYIYGIMLPEEVKKLRNKFYLKTLIGVLAGCVIVYFGWDKPGTIPDLIVLTGMIIALISLLLFFYFLSKFSKMELISIAEEEGREYKESYIEWPPWLKKYGGLLFAIIVNISLLFFGKMHENDFGGLPFVISSAVAGLVSGLVIFYSIHTYKPEWKANKNLGAEIGFYIVIFFVLIFVSYSPVLNKLTALPGETCNEYKIVSTGDQYLTIMNENEEERFEPPRSFLDSLSKTDSTVVLCVKKGGLGFEYVESFKKTETANR